MNELSDRIAGLSPEKRALLEKKLQAKAQQLQAGAAAPVAATEPTSSARRTLPAAPRQRAGERGELEFSLFYFSSDEARASADVHRLVLEGARFADQHGFRAVWTPERHFHPFGGQYPNPSVTSAALAVLTEQVQLRAGSVVLPLHSPLRVAEEWSLVDRLSNGRVGIAFASGWHAHDFAFFPENYPDRREVMYRAIEQVQRLWRGEAVVAKDGNGKPIEVRTYPRPVQQELPIWVTAGGSDGTFRRAGEIGANLLTNLLGQSLEAVKSRIDLYRDSLRAGGHDPSYGTVTLMLHAFLGDDVEQVRRTIRDPFCGYLRSFGGLLDNLAKSSGLEVNQDALSEDDIASILDHAFDRYFETSGLFGTPESCLGLAHRLRDIGVDEVACLIDFGVDDDQVLASLEYLDRLRRLVNADLPDQVRGQAESRDE
jgi:natural product biosynthesis luciferase-like monooxygenase protein